MPPKYSSRSPSQAFPPGGFRTLHEALHRLKADGIHAIKAKCIFPRFDLVLPGSLFVLDCEGSELTLQKGVFKKGLGRVSVLVKWNNRWYIVYDVYVYYPEEDQQIPGFSPKSGVYADDLLPENEAQPIGEVMTNLHKIFSVSGRIIGHALKNEQEYLRGLPWDQYELIDTQLFTEFEKHAHPSANPKIPSLKAIASGEFNWTIQTKQHDSTVDCRATGEAYYKHEAEILAQQLTPEFQAKLLWVPNEDQAKFWAKDATVRSLGALAWQAPIVNATDSDNSDLDTSDAAEIANITQTLGATTLGSRLRSFRHPHRCSASRRPPCPFHWWLPTSRILQ